MTKVESKPNDMRYKKWQSRIQKTILVVGVGLFLTSCETEESKVVSGVHNEHRIKRVNFTNFSQKVSKNNSYDTLEKFFDFNRSKNNSISEDRLQEDPNIIILTDEIVFIKKEEKTFYTFKVITETEGDEFYNLVVHVNEQGEILESVFLEYIPDDDWSSNSAEPYKGSVRSVTNDFFSINNLFSRSQQCVAGVYGEWECSFGNPHAPGTCNGTGFEYIITIEWGPCPTNGGGAVGISGNDENDFGSGGGGSYTTPVTVTIDVLANILGFSFVTEPKKYQWLQDHPEEVSKIADFLDEHQNSEEAKDIVKKAIEILATDVADTFTSNNYPGMDEGLAFNWWHNESFVIQNISFDLDEGFSDLTKAEKLLVALFPLQALAIRANKDPAQSETINRFGFNGRNDKSDAFRHAFFNAMNSNDAGDKVARLFSTAHESEVPPNLALEVQMDLFNNNVGHTFGDNASFFVSDQELSNSVYQALLNGQLVYLSPLDPVVPPNFGINNLTQLTPTNQ